MQRCGIGLRGAACLLAMFAIGLAIAHSQDAKQTSHDLAATWQGTLGQNPTQRIVIHITKESTGAYRAGFFSIDKSGDETRGAATINDGSTVRMTFTLLEATFSGHLTPDGESIEGTWSQNSSQLPLTLTRTAAGAEWAIPPATQLPPPMDAHANPAFDVATIKPSNPDEHRKFFRLSPDHIEGVNETVDDLIIFSYGIHRKQIVGAPSWVESEKFDISAKPDTEGRPSISQWKMMVQKMLADRFQLRFHRSQADIPVYVLSDAPGGAKLQASQGDPNGLPGMGFERGLGDLHTFNVSIADFINFMNRNAGLDRPIVDQTGLSGRYDFKLNWTPDDIQAGQPEVEHPAPPLFTALQEQLGLKLSATKTTTQIYVVEHIEQPSAN